MTNTVKNGDTVTIHYKGTFDDGTEFDSSYSKGEPMTVTVGTGQLISGFDKALDGMTEGETKSISLTSDEAYGPANPENVTTLEKNVFPEDFEFENGRVVPLMGPGGQQFLATITESTDNDVTFDLNHPMAGKDLNFDIEVLEIKTTETESEDETTVGQIIIFSGQSISGQGDAYWTMVPKQGHPPAIGIEGET